MRLNISKLFFCFLFTGICCNKNTKAKIDNSEFENIPVAYQVLDGNINEASGIAMGKKNPGTIWTQEDSGNSPDVILLSDSGTFIKRIAVNGATNRDWEDMAIGNGPAKNTSYIYIAETGDNKRRYEDYCIYRFPEPDVSATETEKAEAIKFIYDDGPHDAEAILLDNKTLDIYIITKREMQGRMYKLSYPQTVGKINTASFVGTFNFSGIVSAAISPENTEVIIKTYSTLYYFKKKATDPIESILKKSFTNPGYVIEPLGEAICFANDDKGFYTFSETRAKMPLFLNFYKRK